MRAETAAQQERGIAGECARLVEANVRAARKLRAVPGRGGLEQWVRYREVPRGGPRRRLRGELQSTTAETAPGRRSNCVALKVRGGRRGELRSLRVEFER